MTSKQAIPDWEELDRQFVWHPYTQMQLTPSVPGVARAEGSYLYLQDGKKVFDAISSWWVTLHGHVHPRIARAIGEQAATLEQVIFAGFTNEPAAKLASRLIDIAPDKLKKVFYSDDGSTAVEVAVKMAVQYWRHRGEKRNSVIAIEGSYHGDTFGAMSVSSRGPFTAPFGDMLYSVTHLPFPEPPSHEREELSPEESRFLDALRTASKDSNIAAFIFEPLLLGAGGMLVWRNQVLKTAIEIVREAGIPAIADEVLTGFGRTGTMFATKQAGISPDIMTLSKGITGGFLPLGATLASQEIYDSFLSVDRGKAFFHGHSFTGNAISAAAANASLDIFESEVVFERIRTIERVHSERMPRVAESERCSLRILGTMAAIQSMSIEGYLSDRFKSLVPNALEQGLLIRPLGDVLYFLPPYSTTEGDLHRAYDILEGLLGIG